MSFLFQRLGRAPKLVSSFTQRSFSNVPRTPKYGDFATIITENGKEYLALLKPNGHLQTDRIGTIFHHDLIKASYGTAVTTSNGRKVLLLPASTRHIMENLKRKTQIIFPREAAHIVAKLNLCSGMRVVEAGTGSGSLTTALARAVAPTGRVITFDVEPEHQMIAKDNLEKTGYLPFVDMSIRDVAKDGFGDCGEVDAMFLDMRDPSRAIPKVAECVKPGGFFVSLVPTTNQVCDLITALEQHSFSCIEVEELIVRDYKPVATRFRVKETTSESRGLIVTARVIDKSVDHTMFWSMETKKHLARVEYDNQCMSETEQQEDADWQIKLKEWRSKFSRKSQGQASADD